MWLDGHFKNKLSEDKEAHPIPVCVGPPGIGKSRLLESVVSFFQQHKSAQGSNSLFTNAVEVLVTFGNGFFLFNPGS